MTLHSKITPQTPTPQTYADYLALGMQKADKALPGGSTLRKQDYARSYANSRAPVDLPRPPERTYADFLAEARARQAGAGFASPLLSVTDEQLARADAMIGWTNERARQRHGKPVENGGFRLTAYGLERVK